MNSANQALQRVVDLFLPDDMEVCSSQLTA